MFSRRRDLIAVADVVGMSPSQAKREADLAGLWLRGPEADAGPLDAVDIATANGVITDQAPKPGLRVDPGSGLAVWIERNDGPGGTRGPDRPRPDPGGHKPVLEWTGPAQRDMARLPTRVATAVLVYIDDDPPTVWILHVDHRAHVYRPR